MFSFDDKIHVGNVHALIKSAQYARQVLIDLQNDNIRLLDDSLRDSRAAGQIEETVPVHGGHTHHGDVHCQKMPVIRLQIPENHRNVAAEPPVAELPLIGGAVPAVVAEMLPLRIALDRHDRSEAEIPTDFHIVQFVPAFCQRRVQKRRKADIGPVIDPVSALYSLHGLVRSPEFFIIFSIKIHIFSDCLPVLSGRLPPALALSCPAAFSCSLLSCPGSPQLLFVVLPRQPSAALFELFRFPLLQAYALLTAFPSNNNFNMKKAPCIDPRDFIWLIWL